MPSGRVLIAIAVLVMAAGVFTTTAVHALVYATETEVAPPASVEKAAPLPIPGLHPGRIVIPAIGVDAATQYLGVNASGRMAAPWRYDQVDWYKHGPEPGQSWSFITHRHLDNRLGLNGVFIP